MKKILSKLFLGAFLLGLILPATSASAGYVSVSTSVKNLTAGGSSAQEISANASDEILVLARVLNDTPAATGNLAFYAKLPAGVSFVSGSGKLTYRDATGADKVAPLGDSIVASNGVMIGDVPAMHFVYASYKVKASAGSYSISNEVFNGSNINVASNSAKINISGSTTAVQGQNVTAGSTDATSGVSVKSLVSNFTKGDNKFSESVVADRGDELYYRITVDNSSTGTAKALAAYVQIPFGLQYVPGYSKLYYTDANGQDKAAPITDAIANATGAMIGDLPADHYEYIVYKVKVADNAPAGTYATGNQVFNNVINVSDNTGKVMVDVLGTKPVTQSLTINATAYNATVGANVAYANVIDASRGDVIKFRVAIANVSNSVLKNAKVTNALPTNMEYVADSLKVVISGNAVNASDINTISLGDLSVGANGTIEFSAKVKNDTPKNTAQLIYSANGIADGISQVSSIVTINLDKVEALPSTGPLSTILALIILAMFISVASYMYLKESNALTNAVKLIKR